VRCLVTELKVTAHPCYLHHRGKPLLSVWGMGLEEYRHVPRDPETALRVVKWFQANAPPELRVTFMGGVPARWRTLIPDALKEDGWRNVYARMDVIQPWNVGRYGMAAQVGHPTPAMASAGVQEQASRHCRGTRRNRGTQNGSSLYFSLPLSYV
jgi:hypothetical protein